MTRSQRSRRVIVDSVQIPLIHRNPRNFKANVDLQSVRR